MRAIATLLLYLLSAMVEVHSQIAPYLTFMGTNIPNHSYVDLNTVGGATSNDSLKLQCHTDLTTCCSGAQGPNPGTNPGTSPMERGCHFMGLAMFLFCLNHVVLSE